MNLKLLTSALFIFLLISCQNNSSGNKNNDNTAGDSFLGNWYDCDNSDWEFFIKADGENYVFHNKFGDQVLGKKNSTRLEAKGGSLTVSFDPSSNHLVVNGNGPAQEFCKAHGNDADANDKNSRENTTNYSDQIGERPTNTKIGNLEVMNKDLGKVGGYNWNEAREAARALGDGWRLPTRAELNMMYQNRVNIGGFNRQSYWTSTEENLVRVYRDANNKEQSYKCSWTVPFGQRDKFNKEGFTNQGSFISVRVVRTN